MIFHKDCKLNSFNNFHADYIQLEMNSKGKDKLQACQLVQKAQSNRERMRVSHNLALRQP